eukprot:GFKZ01001080.1.p1 GENE.GFKZ01001080.1~~GFKZ01001080.1.p1  ORF type:complete len:220 (+),score=14.74 GFKZ01001080.1:98-757(+)
MSGALLHSFACAPHTFTTKHLKTVLHSSPLLVTLCSQSITRVAGSICRLPTLHDNFPSPSIAYPCLAQVSMPSMHFPSLPFVLPPALENNSKAPTSPHLHSSTLASPSTHPQSTASSLPTFTTYKLIKTLALPHHPTSHPPRRYPPQTTPPIMVLKLPKSTSRKQKKEKPIKAPTPRIDSDAFIGTGLKRSNIGVEEYPDRRPSTTSRTPRRKTPPNTS